MRRSMVAATMLVGLGALAAEGCGIFSSGECTDLAICPDQAGVEAGTGPDVTTGADGMTNMDAYTAPDVLLDTLVGPGDGPLPDGTCNMGIEDCTNGKDDNCNGLIDCADPVCTAGYICTDAPPAGWSGPVSEWDAASGPRPSCTGAFAVTAVDGNGSLSAPGATCSCTCPSPATGQTCGFASPTIYSDGSCSTVCASDGLPYPGSPFCVNFSTCGTTGSVNAPTFAPSGGSCTPSSSKSLPATPWGMTGRTCSYSGKVDMPGGCSSSAQCVTRPSSPFGGPCVYQNGDLACPSGYPTKHLYYAGVSDNRDCAACNCNSPTGGTCTGTVDLYDTGSCSGTKVTTVTLGAGCQAVSGAMSPGFRAWQVPAPFGVMPGSCTPSGGGAIGSATPTGPTTVCCQ